LGTSAIGDGGYEGSGAPQKFEQEVRGEVGDPCSRCQDPQTPSPSCICMLGSAWTIRLYRLL